MAIAKTIHRIITCQGSIQLANALSILMYRDASSTRVHDRDQQFTIHYQNYLVIYGLYAPDHQDQEFALFIQKMAEAVYDWSAIIYLTPDRLRTIEQQLSSTPPARIYETVYRWIGIDQADEIYLCRNWQFANQLLINAYQAAYRICYGDGIGLYFSEQSAVVRRPPDELVKVPWLRRQARSFKHQLLERLRLKTVLSSLDFDIGYFLLPYILGEVPPMPIVPLDSSYLMTIFIRLLEFANDDSIAELQALGNATISFLLTSNFSEGEQISQHHEILAYREFLLTHTSTHPGSVLIIKPHPRDNLDKIHQLKQALSDQYKQVIILASTQLCFLPFEILFLKLFSQSNSNVCIFAFSSSCLSLKLLFNVPSCIGFGDRLVSQFFDPNYINARREHEQILRQALEKLSHEQFA